MTAPFGEQLTRVETSPGGVGFIRTKATKDLPAMPESERQVWLTAQKPPASTCRDCGHTEGTHNYAGCQEWLDVLRRIGCGCESWAPGNVLTEQEWDWPRACPWCATTVPVGVPTVLVDGEHVCQECAQ